MRMFVYAMLGAVLGLAVGLPLVALLASTSAQGNQITPSPTPPEYRKVTRADIYNKALRLMIQEAPKVGACERGYKLNRFQSLELLTRWIEAAGRMHMDLGGTGDTTRFAEQLHDLYQSGLQGKIGRVNMRSKCYLLRLDIQGA